MYRHFLGLVAAKMSVLRDTLHGQDWEIDDLRCVHFPARARAHSPCFSISQSLYGVELPQRVGQK
jgi:hypothetical protein